MIHISRQLKDLIHNLAKSTDIEAHVLIRRFMMERLLGAPGTYSCKPELRISFEHFMVVSII